MDPLLAQIYGTNQDSDAADVEKLAAAEMAEGLADDAGVNVNDLSEEQIEAMAQEVLNGVSQDDEEQAASQEDPEEEVLAKVAEADKLGRVMAHSMWQELGSIQKEAGVKEIAEGAKKAGGKVLGHLRDVAGKTGKAVKDYHTGAAKDIKHAVTGKANKGAIPSGKMTRAKAGAKGVAKFLPHAGAAGAVGYGAKEMMSKKSSALDTLAEQHALEILAASGIDPETLELQQEKVSEADPAEVLGNAVEQRAWEILSQYGVVPQE